MPRVSVAEGAKPRPKESFKFLRRDEGRLSYAAAGTADSPSRSGGNGSEGDKVNRERRDSKSLREAIAFDMRNARSHDPLGEVVVAVPRKAPPPNRAASTPPPQTGARGESPAPVAQQRRPPPPAAAAKRKPEWVNPEVPPARPALSTRDDAAPIDDGEGAGWGRYGGNTPRRAGSAVSAPQRHVDVDYDDAPASPAADRNYFRRPTSQQPPSAVSSRGREEDDLMLNLEQEIRAAQEEREHYASAKQQLDRERQRFDAYRHSAEQQLEEARAEGSRAREQREAQRDLRSTEERYRSVSALLVTEREASRRLTQENDTLRTQLEELTSTLRESQQAHKAELARMRRDIDSLNRRNAELLAMAKEQQVAALSETAAAASSKAASPAARKAGASSRNASAARERSAAAAPAPSLDAADLSSSERRGPASVPGVMDFTPRAGAGEEAAWERRNRQMADRIEAERADMDERRRQRERDAAERRQAEEESQRRTAAAAEAAARRQREEDEAAAEAQRRQERERREREAAAAAAAAKPLEERKSAGHPLNTPRVQAGSSGGGAVAVKKRPAAAAAHPPVAPKSSSSRIAVPTREELLGDVEPPPTEDVTSDSVVSTTALGDNPNKRETLYRSGKREIHYANGTVKAVLPTGHTILHFTNGDVKCTFPSGKSTYWYDAAQTMHTQMPDGVQTFEFRTTGQAERHLPDGGKSILYPDGIYKVVRKDGTDETYHPDGELMEE